VSLVPSKLSIKNTDVLRFLIREFNDNSLKDKIIFSIANFMVTNQNGIDSLLIQKLALNEDNFDVVEYFNEETYTTTSKAFIPMNLNSFNAQITALPQEELKEITYDTTLDFLVYVSDIKTQELINLAIEEVRSKLIQKYTTFDVEYVDLENPNNKNRIKETLKVIVMAGSLEYGNIVTINNKRYMTYHLDITMLFTNSGEFANQNRFKLGCESIRDENDEVIMFDIAPLSWSWGQIITHESTQLLNDIDITLLSNADEIKSVPKNTSYSISFDLQMDFKNRLLRQLYINSKKNEKGRSKEKYYLVDITEEYDETQKKFVQNPDMTFTRTMYLGINQPNDDLSKGQKMIWTISLVPAYEEVGEVYGW
jgi:hypothetical protein